MTTRNKPMQKILCFVITIMFFVNNLAYGLAPGVVSGDSRPNGETVKGDMYAAGQKLFAANRGPGAIDFDSYVARKGFTGEVPEVAGVKFGHANNEVSMPEGWDKNYLLSNDVSDIIQALIYFRDHEANLPTVFDIRERYFKVDSRNGELPISRWEFDKKEYRWVLVVHTDFVRMWNDIKKNDIWFEYTFPDGQTRTISLAWAIFYRIAKHEMSDLKKGTAHVKSLGHMTSYETGVDINRDELVANAIKGRYNIVNDAIWMWFFGSYAFGAPTQHNNDLLKDRLQWFFEGKDAQEMKLNLEFPNLLQDDAARAFAIDLALAVNQKFYEKYEKLPARPREAAQRQGLKDQYRTRKPRISDTMSATGMRRGSLETPTEGERPSGRLARPRLRSSTEAAPAKATPAKAAKTRKGRRADGTFAPKPGKSPKDALEKVIARSYLLKNGLFTVAQYIEEYRRIASEYGDIDPQISETTARSDLYGKGLKGLPSLVEQGLLEKKDETLVLTERGKTAAALFNTSEREAAAAPKPDSAVSGQDETGFIDEKGWPNPAQLTPDKRVVMLISGGESAGVNTYFARLAQKLARHGYSLELVRFGLNNMVSSAENFAKNRMWVTAKLAGDMLYMPGAYAGTARVKLDDKNHPEYMPNAVANIKGYCKTIVMIGGNDHLGEASKLAKKFKEEGLDIEVIALPKTIDRDTKVYPIGADTAGRHAHDFVLRAAPLPGSNRCTVIEMMGRDMGWLTARAGDMRPDDLSGYTESEKNKMQAIAPTMVVAVPEYSVDKNKRIIVSLSDIVDAVRARMQKYGAATVLVSEGFRMSENDPLLKKILEGNAFLRTRFSRVGKDAQGNLLLNDLGVADFVSEAISMNVQGLSRGDNLVREVFGYAMRARELSPDNPDAMVAEEATDKAAELIVDPEKRADVISRGGVCVSALIGLKDARDAKATMEARNFDEVTGKVDLTDSGLFTADKLRQLNVLGTVRPTENLTELPQSAGKPVQSAGKNIELAIKAINSMSESALDMNRINICAVSGSDAEDIIAILSAKDRTPISVADKYVQERVERGVVFISSAKGPVSLADLLKNAYATYGREKFLNMVVPGGLSIRKDDEILALLRSDEVCNALIEGARKDNAGNLVFGEQIADLISMSLTSDAVLERLAIKDKKMSGIRKNILNGSLDLLPGEAAPEPISPLTTKELAKFKSALDFLDEAILGINSRPEDALELIEKFGFVRKDAVIVDGLKKLAELLRGDKNNDLEIENAYYGLLNYLARAYYVRKKILHANQNTRLIGTFGKITDAWDTIVDLYKKQQALHIVWVWPGTAGTDAIEEQYAFSLYGYQTGRAIASLIDGGRLDGRVSKDRPHPIFEDIQKRFPNMIGMEIFVDKLESVESWGVAKIIPILPADDQKTKPHEGGSDVAGTMPASAEVTAPAEKEKLPGSSQKLYEDFLAPYFAELADHGVTMPSSVHFPDSGLGILLTVENAASGEHAASGTAVDNVKKVQDFIKERVLPFLRETFPGADIKVSNPFRDERNNQTISVMLTPAEPASSGMAARVEEQLRGGATGAEVSEGPEAGGRPQEQQGIEPVAVAVPQEEVKDMSEVFSEYILRIAADKGPGAMPELTPNDVGAVYKTLGLLQEKRIEILLPQSMKLTESMKKALDDMRKKYGEHAIKTREYTGKNHLGKMLENQPATGTKIKRIIVTVPEMVDDVKGLVNEYPDLFKDTRIYNAALPEGYGTMSQIDKTVCQARAINIAILMRLLEKDNNTPLVEGLLRIALDGRLDKRVELNDFINHIVKDDQTDNLTRILWFLELDRIVSLVEKLGKELMLLRMVWTSA